MNINQAIIELQKLQENGKGDLDLIVYQYTGGDDVAFNICFELDEFFVTVECAGLYRID